MCAGVVKASAVYPKNPAQHFADLKMLAEKEVFSPVFTNSATSLPKSIEVIRVDGAGDEGPLHEEVQYWWTEKHLLRPTQVTLVTACESGGSFKNQVELQNGCLARAHTGLFIASSLKGPSVNEATGQLDLQCLQANMKAAMDTYIARVDGAPCGSTAIHLFPGADGQLAREVLDRRPLVLQYLKGTAKQREQLQKNKPAEFKHISSVWAIRKPHMVSCVPSKYAFFLRCCGEADCSHPLCCNSTQLLHAWYEGGPSLSTVLAPCLEDHGDSLPCAKE